MATPGEFDNAENQDTLDDYIATMLHYECPQDQWELSRMLSLIEGKKSLLEVGSNFGGTLKRMATKLAPDALIVSVDYPFDDTPKWLNPVGTLKKNCKQIAAKGHRVELFIADSHAADTVAKVKALGPYDFGFIDGDHSYEGVKADWDNYGPMCKTVGFHDIAGPVEGCTRFWKELRDSGRFGTREFINPQKKFGIGIVYRE